LLGRPRIPTIWNGRSRNDLKAWAMADDRFHRTLVTDCGNGKLARLAATVTIRLSEPV